MSKWTKTNDYYNREVVSNDVWSRNIPKGKLYIIDAENFMYTVSRGIDSEHSFTGSFFGTTIKTLKDAMEYLDKFIPLWLNDNFKGLNQLKLTIEK